jgi:hypothetical protein
MGQTFVSRESHLVQASQNGNRFCFAKPQRWHPISGLEAVSSGAALNRDAIGDKGSEISKNRSGGDTEGGGELFEGLA